MSAKYSSSPALHLTVGSSTVRRRLHGVFCLCTATALYLLCQRGYPLLSLLLLSPVTALLWLSHRESMVGTRIGWQQGCWSVLRGENLSAVQVLPGSVCLPWVIYLAWREVPGGRRGAVWLFQDSAPAGTLRRLRVRLTLQR